MAHLTQKFFEDNEIRHNEKIKPLKAILSEYAIFRVKKTLYNELRFRKSKNWVKYLPSAVNRVNNTPLKILNGHRPSDFKSKFDDYKIPLPENIPEPEALLRRQRKYEANKKNLQVGDQVWLDDYVFAQHNNFPKSSDIQVKIFLRQFKVKKSLEREKRERVYDCKRVKQNLTILFYTKRKLYSSKAYSFLLNSFILHLILRNSLFFALTFDNFTFTFLYFCLSMPTKVSKRLKFDEKV